MAPSEGIEPPVQEPESYVLSITPRGPFNIKMTHLKPSIDHPSEKSQ